MRQPPSHRSLRLAVLACAGLALPLGCRDRAPYDAVVARHKPFIEDLVAAIAALPKPDAEQIHLQRDRGGAAKPVLEEPLERPAAPALLAENRFAAPIDTNLLVIYGGKLGTTPNNNFGSKFGTCFELIRPEAGGVRDSWYKAKPAYWEALLSQCHIRYVAVASVDSMGGCEGYGQGGGFQSQGALCSKGLFDLWDMVARKRLYSAMFDVPLPDHVRQKDIFDVQENLMTSGAERAVYTAFKK